MHTQVFFDIVNCMQNFIASVITVYMRTFEKHFCFVTRSVLNFFEISWFKICKIYLTQLNNSPIIKKVSSQTRHGSEGLVLEGFSICFKRRQLKMWRIIKIRLISLALEKASWFITFEPLFNKISYPHPASPSLDFIRPSFSKEKSESDTKVKTNFFFAFFTSFASLAAEREWELLIKSWNV